MKHLLFESDDVHLGLVGRIHADRSRPALLVVNGSFPPDDLMHELVDGFPGAHVLVANLPGMAGVYWKKTTVAEMTLTLDAAVKRLLPRDPLVVLGISTGNLVALGLRAGNICHRVAVEPFFQTEPLWPFIANSRERLQLQRSAEVSEYMGHFFWEVFGVAPTALENRDYRYLLDRIECPTDVLVGGLPLLPQRDLDEWPSFTSDEDRARLAANPLVSLNVGPAGIGHRYGLRASDRNMIHTLLHGALVAASRACD
jgi:hypothetical protein